MKSTIISSSQKYLEYSVVRNSEASFQELKDYLSIMTKLCPPEPRPPLLLYVSASNPAVSVVLVQEKEEEGKLK
jgi:hypothetical protein